MAGDSWHLALASASPVSRVVHLTIAMLAIAALVGVVTKIVRVPYTIALVIVGLAIAVFGLAPAGVHITHDVVLLLFLPPLLFQAGLHLDLEHLKGVRGPVAVMAIAGVVVTMFAVGAAARPFLVETLGAGADVWGAALLLGVVLAPTDPISVMATFRTAGAPDRLRTLVEGESLFNDGTAVAIFGVLEAAVVGGVAGVAGAANECHMLEPGRIGAFEIAGEFAALAGLGVVVGFVMGLFTFVVLRRLNDHTLETAITIALAWGAYVVAESLHASGVIAVVVAGLIIGNYGKVLSMSKETVTTLTGFWDSLDFVINSLLFLLIGFELADPAVGGVERLVAPATLLAAGAALLAMHASRAAMVFVVTSVWRRGWEKGWRRVIWWAGLRGSLSMALLLGLPDGELRNTLTPIAFLVVLVSLLSQGLTMSPLMRRCGVGGEKNVVVGETA